MKKAIAIVLSLIFVFAVTSLTFAAQVTGEVTAVDAKAMSITVKGKKDVTAVVDDKTKITAGKDKKTLADVKAGDKVTVKFTEADGKNTAKSIEIKPALAKKEAAPKAEKKEAAPAKKEAAPAAAPAPAPAPKKSTSGY